MGQIQEVVEKFGKGSHTKSLREDLRKPENSMIFSEESSRIIHELGNSELYEFGQSPAPSLPFMLQGHAGGISVLSMCLRPDEATITRIHGRFETLSVLLFRPNKPTKGKKCGESP